MTNLCYAGVGARKTPNQILKVMSHIGSYLYSEGWTLRSGGAHGADEAFETGVDEVRRKEGKQATLRQSKNIYLPWNNHNGNPSNLHPEQLPFTEQEIELTSQFHPNWGKCRPSVKRMHIRNTRIILGHALVDGPIVNPVKFLVCWTPEGKTTGGTGQGIRMAQGMGIQIFNLGAPDTPDSLEAMIKELDAFQAKIKEAPHVSIT